MISKINKIRILAVLSGFIVMELEILGTRIFTPVFGSTIYVWTSLITVTLTFLALGYWYGGKLADKGKIHINTLGLIILFVGFYIALLPYISRVALYATNGLDIVWGPLVASLMVIALPVFFLGFIVPTSIKLVTTSLSEVAGKVGEIYSLATVGSIVGTFSTGYFFILYLGVAKTSLITGIILILFSLLILEPKKKFFFFFLIPLLFFTQPGHPAEVLELLDGHYGQTRIIQNGEHLRLYKGILPQTAINATTRENEMGYIRYFEPLFVDNADYKDVLMIGFGGGYTAKELVTKYNLTMDIVEVDPKMIGLAEKYFDWDNEASVYFDDGRHFVSKAGVYDVIILDIGHVFPVWHLSTLEAFKVYSEHLNSGGALVINLFSAKEGEYSKVTKTLYKTLMTVYDEVFVLRSPSTEPENTQSMALVAFKGGPDGDKLFSRINDSEDLIFSAENISAEHYVDEELVVGLTTDDRPLAEFYDYKNWQEWGTIGRSGLKYFLP